MDLKRPLVLLAVAGVLAGCSSSPTGGNTNVDRGTTECGAAEAGSNRTDCSDSEDAPTQGG
jgi:hypothetical protein